jgi:predicted Zn-dependent protease with MMP-like domain
MVRVTGDRFEELVRQAVESLPQEFLDRLDNVDVTVEDEPSRVLLREQGLGRGSTLFGLYQGVPLTHRGSYGGALPDKITIFQGPLQRACQTEEDLVGEVRITVAHEIAHFFGIDDDRLDELGL